jgi:hypothetical protein
MILQNCLHEKKSVEHQRVACPRVKINHLLKSRNVLSGISKLLTCVALFLCPQIQAQALAEVLNAPVVPANAVSAQLFEDESAKVESLRMANWYFGDGT